MYVVWGRVQVSHLIVRKTSVPSRALLHYNQVSTLLYIMSSLFDVRKQVRNLPFDST